MITLKSQREIEIMARAGRIVAATLELVRRTVRPGVTTSELDDVAEKFIRSHPGATPSFKGLYGFPRSLCVSINDEIVHGIPSRQRVLREGSIVSVDVGVQVRGFPAAAAPTVAVGEIAPATRRLLDVTQEALAAGIAQAKVGNHVGDIGHAVQTGAGAAGLVAQGGGRRSPAPPPPPTPGPPRRGPRLRAGMPLATEPMITAGDYTT